MTKKIGKHRLCVTIIFLVFSDIADFGGVLLVLLVTWVLRTLNPLNSAKSPWVVYVTNFSPLVHPLLIDFGEGCSSSCSSCDRGKTRSTHYHFHELGKRTGLSCKTSVITWKEESICLWCYCNYLSLRHTHINASIIWNWKFILLALIREYKSMAEKIGKQKVKVISCCITERKLEKEAESTACTSL